MISLALTINKRKSWLYTGIASLIVFGIFVLISPALGQNSISQSVLTFLGWILLPIINFLGNMLLVFIDILINFFSYTEFIDTPAVQLGWVIVRDLANMIIVVGLIIIAFATVFRVQQYSASKLLVRLVIAAFFVNFSLLVTGLLIDFGQVIMMTFVNNFRDLAAGNLTVGLGIESMLKVATGAANPALDTGTLGSTFSAMLLAIVLLLVASGVVLVFIVVLLQRVLYLWMLAIFSPIAWVAPLIPGGASWGSRWWDLFLKQVFIGPLLAFGFWLSMSILAGLAAKQHLIDLVVTNTSSQIIAEDSSQIARFVSEISTPQAIFDFMVTIGLLIVTLLMAKLAGGAAGGYASTVFSKFSGAGRTAIRLPFRAAGGAARLAGRGAGAAVKSVTRKPIQVGLGLVQGLTQRALSKVRLDKASRDKRGRDIGVAREGAFEKAAGEKIGIGRRDTAKFAATQDETKKLDEKGLMRESGQAKAIFGKAIESGDEIRARAALTRLADNGDLTEVAINGFHNKFGRVAGEKFDRNNISHRESAQFDIDLYNRTGKAGDVTAKYKAHYTRNDKGDLIEQSFSDQFIEDEFKNMTIENIRKVVAGKSLETGYDNDSKQVLNKKLPAMMLGMSDATLETIGRAIQNPGQRKKFAKNIADVIAARDEYGLDNGQVDRLAKLHQHLTAKRYDPQGRAQASSEDDVADDDSLVLNNIGKLPDTVTARTKQEQKLASNRAKDMKLGNEKPIIEEQKVRDIFLKDNDAISTWVSKAKKSLSEGHNSELDEAIGWLENEFAVQVAALNESGQDLGVDSATGEKLSAEDLIKKSKTGQALASLSDLKHKLFTEADYLTDEDNKRFIDNNLDIIRLGQNSARFKKDQKGANYLELERDTQSGFQHIATQVGQFTNQATAPTDRAQRLTSLKNIQALTEAVKKDYVKSRFIDKRYEAAIDSTLFDLAKATAREARSDRKSMKTDQFKDLQTKFEKLGKFYERT